MNDLWAMVHAERAALIADLEGLDADSWEKPSTCGDWTVHEVAAHLVDNARTTRISFIVNLAKARFDFDRLNARGVERERGTGPHDTLQSLRQVATRESMPPAPRDTRLVEEIVHGEDIRRPLGITRRYPDDGVIRALQLQARTAVSFGGAKEHVAGLQLVGSDVDVTIGEGATVVGPVLSLLCAISGRPVLGELDGPGMASLTSRISQ